MPAAMLRTVYSCLIVVGLALQPVVAQDTGPQGSAGTPAGVIAQRPARASFGPERASDSVRHLADWIVDSGDSQGMPFVIVDKIDARVYVFYPDGRLRGAAAALLGAAIGDDSGPGIGNRKLSSIRPDERTTPAGRFVASLDRNLHGEEILWIDYDAAISMHRVITTNPAERRAQRLASPSPLDNRISYGCINVPVPFFDQVLSPAFKGTNGIVYVLPETRSPASVFASRDVDERRPVQAARQTAPPRGKAADCAAAKSATMP